MRESFRKIALLMFYLAVQQLSPMLAALNVNDIEKYIITRRGRNDTDLFRVVYDNSRCPVNVCGSSNAYMLNTTQCACTCKPDNATFLPELGKCSDAEAVKKSLFESKYM